LAWQNLNIMLLLMDNTLVLMAVFREVVMSLEVIKDAISNKKMLCPQCTKPIQRYEKFAETIDSVWDGFGDSRVESRGSRVTLICGNGACTWNERTEFWSQYMEE
jgi:hypothetical protein